MAGSGFGKTKQAKQATKGAERRSQAAKQYDKMQADGSPEFTIFIQVKNSKNWFPVGSLAVNRTHKINQAIFEQEAELLQGAFRLFPLLKKNQSQLEYGYRLKQYPDEPIQLAELPQPGTTNALQSAVGAVKERVTGLFKRSR